MEETFVMIKPDGYKMNVFNDVVKTFIINGLGVMNINVLELDEDLISEHYSHLIDKPFFPHLKEFMLSGPVITMTVVGENAVSKVRELIGATNPNNAVKGTIREKYGNKIDTTQNVIHASDSVINAQIEIERFNSYANKYIKTLKK